MLRSAAPSKNYRYSTNHQVVIDADTELVVALGRPSPGNRNDCGGTGWTSLWPCVIRSIILMWFVFHDHVAGRRSGEAYRDALGLDTGLDFHGLRRSYVTHLIEAGRDPLFVQFQCGHEHASTTSIYACVSSDFRTATLRRAIDDTLAAAIGDTARRTR